jgi:hypothetical protein
MSFKPFDIIAIDNIVENFSNQPNPCKVGALVAITSKIYKQFAFIIINPKWRWFDRELLDINS